MIDKKLIPDMSTPEGIKQAFEHVREHRDSDPDDLTRVVNLELLRLLQEEGVEEAELLEEELKRTARGSGEPLYTDIRSVGDAYTEDQAAAVSGDQHIDLKRIAGIAYAVSGITAATFAGASGNGGLGKTTLEGAREKLEGIGSSDEAQEAQRVLGGVMDNMVEVMPVPEQ